MFGFRVLMSLFISNLLFVICVPLSANSISDKKEFMVHPIVVTRKVLRDESLPECFGNLSVKPYKKISKVQLYEANLKKTVRVYLAHNEYESAQIVIKSLTDDLHNVKIKVNVIHHKKKIPFPSKNISLLRVGYVNTYNLWNKKQSLGWWPDPLFPIKQDEDFDVPKGQNQPILIRFYADKEIPSGLYKGKIIITADGCDQQILPLKVIVWDFCLPKEQHVTISIPIWGGQMEKMYGKSVAKRWHKKYISMLLDYRISPFPLKMSDTLYARKRGMKQFCILTLPKDHVPKNLKETTMKRIKEWEQAELFEKGAVPYALLGDEPQPKHWVNIIGQGKIIHQVDKRILRMNTVAIESLVNSKKFKGIMDAYEQAYNTLGNEVDYFILATGCYPVGKATKLAYKKRQKVWWYSVADVVYIPTAGGYVRVHFWKMWKYNVPGWLHWGMTYWGNNVKGKNGRKWPDVPWDTKSSRSGDGYLVYPARGGKGYWPSLRLEFIRDGVEDYEYFWLLKHLTKQLQAVNSAKYSNRISTNNKLLAIDNGVVASYREATKDGEVLLASRKRLANAIQSTQRIIESNNIKQKHTR